MKKIKVLAVIPARGGSKGLPRKNIRNLANKPLIAHAIEEAKKCKLIDRLIVSTDDEEIAEVAKRYGAEVPFLRPKELATDEISIIPVLKHTIEFFESNGYAIENIVSIQPNNPLITTEEIGKIIEKLLNTNCDSVVSIVKMHEHPYRAMKLEGDKLKPLFPEHEKYLQRQDLPEFYRFSGAIYARKAELIKNWNGKDFALGDDVRGVVVDEKKAIDIHTEIDLKLAELLIKDENR